MNEATTTMDSPLLVIAAFVLVGLLLIGIARKLMKLVLVTSVLAILVVGLFIARSAGVIDW
jgi:hypothetical protein